MQFDQTNASGDFPLAPTTTVTETHLHEGLEIIVSYSVTPEENYAGPPGTAAPPKPTEPPYEKM